MVILTSTHMELLLLFLSYHLHLINCCNCVFLFLPIIVVLRNFDCRSHTHYRV